MASKSTLLIINPNTTAEVTARVADLARRQLAGMALGALDVVAATGRFGAAYIASRASFAVAGHAALEALAEHGAAIDGVLLACFGDPGLDALREVSPVPVIGLVEASIAEAGVNGRPFAIVTGGERWGPMLAEQIRLRGLESGLAAILTVAPTGGQIAADPSGAIDLLAQACRAAAREHGAEAVILGGAGLIRLAEPVAAAAGLPVICSVEAGIRAAGQALRDANRRDAATLTSPSVGLSPALAELFARGSLA